MGLTPKIDVKPRIPNPSTPWTRNWRFHAPHCFKVLSFGQVPIGSFIRRSYTLTNPPASCNDCAAFSQAKKDFFIAALIFSNTSAHVM